MFPITTPYSAEFEEITAEGRTVKTEWRPCRVIGITRDENDEPAYVVEAFGTGVTFLRIEPYIRRQP